MNNTKIIWLAMAILTIIAIIGVFTPLGNQAIKGFAGVGSVTNFSSLTLDDNLIVGKTSTFTGTTTVSNSYDGFVLWDDFTVSTSTTVVRGALTNNGSPLMCDGDSLAVYAKANSGTSLLDPTFKFVVGTTTSATAYSASLIASTTVATSTDTILGIASGWPFLLANGSSITVSVGDALSNASSTYYGNWTGQISIHCWTLGQ